MKFAVFGVNFGMPQKSRTKTHEIPAAHPLAGGGVLVAVVGPSPGRGEGKNEDGSARVGTCSQWTSEAETAMRGHEGRAHGRSRPANKI